MKKNLGYTERVTRIILAAILGFLYYSNTITGTLGIIVLVVAVVLLVTSFVSFCPLYAMLGLKTRHTKTVK